MRAAPDVEPPPRDGSAGHARESRVLLLLDQRENRSLLLEELGDRHQVVPASGDEALEEEFDLCILDGRSLDRLGERVQRRKAREEPAFLPSSW